MSDRDIASIPLAFERHPETEMRRRARDFHEKLRKRRSVRDFSDEIVPRDIVEQCLLAAGSGATIKLRIRTWRRKSQENTQ